MATLPNRAGPDPRRARRGLTDRVTRRHLIGVAAGAVLAAVGVVRALPDPSTGRPAAGPDGDPASGDPVFDEMYRGRRIQGRPAVPGQGHAPDGWQVTVDGQRLGLMRRADGSYLSMVDHYQSYATPLAATRGAVDELGPGQTLSGRLH
ncbi:tyrosinase cofactor [Streptomyces sp. NPDC047123]|uniref:tyrosinase cofactor n=1 Tax=Streptomyces sp. NPDC047123 TaxID=3155622 RepID=UPI0033DE0595